MAYNLKTLGIVNNGKTLRIFDRFEVDYDLPKYKKLQENEERAARQQYSKSMASDFSEDPDSEEPSEGDMSPVFFTSSAVENLQVRNGVIGISNPSNQPIVVSGNTFTVSNGEWISNEDSGSLLATTGAAPAAPKPEPEGFWKTLWRGVTRQPLPVPPPPPPAPPKPEPEKPVPVQYVFDLILKNDEELRLFNDRNREFEALIDRTEKAGQKSLLKKLRQEAEVRKYENALYALGQTKFLSEAQLLKFAEKVEKGLSLDWIQHFARPIPADVIKKKVQCDESYLFDNWVILHYDPEGKAITPEDREAEIARRKDPILFGVMKGSRRLYFVADWKDEQCDLTLAEIVEKIGESVDMPEHI